MKTPLDYDVLAKLHGVPVPSQEFKFHPDRRWRLDLVWFRPRRLAVEIEGGAFIRGRHNRGTGFLADMTKYNALTMAGWPLLRFTPQQMQTGEAWGTIREFLEKNP